MNERYIIEYLSSPQWKAKRKAVKKRCNDICERCHLYLVDEVHHLTYERIYNERLEDLQGLCAGCHEFLHRKSGIDPLQKSIHVTVSGKIIEFWDSQAGKHRRVNIAKLPPERFRWCRMYAGDKLIETFLEKLATGPVRRADGCVPGRARQGGSRSFEVGEIQGRLVDREPLVLRTPRPQG